MPDLAVVGGGPAGLAVAIVARKAGFSVVVVERARPPVDKACGEGLMPSGKAALERLGVVLPPEQARPFRGIRYISLEDGGRTVAEGQFLGGLGVGIRRTVLHGALVRRAEELGVVLQWGVRATGLSPDGPRVGGDVLEARWIVGADGLHSMVRRWAGLEARPGRRRRYGLRRHFAVAPWSDHVEVYWTAGAEAYVTPVGENEIGVALLRGPAELHFDEMLGRIPELAERLAGAALTSKMRGAGPFHQRTRGVCRGKVALVGDASGYLDPITGEGVALAFRQAESLVRVLEQDDLTAYASAHARVVAGYRRVTELLMFLQRHERLRIRAVRALGDAPDLFSRMLAVHDGALPPSALGAGGVARLAWGMVRG
jgi:flavin-dependent dehydrogenase